MRDDGRRSGGRSGSPAVVGGGWCGFCVKG